jgi:antitoxin (DNA-binding transcriptional repressor) of toxin-antitoxin stability system
MTSKVAVLMLVAGLAGCASARRTPAYCAELRGAGPGSDALDPEASGSARLEFDGATIRFQIRTANLGKVVATHLHAGPAGVNGPMAHELNPGFLGETFEGSTVVSEELARAVLANPSQYYVKLHSRKVPGGAIRGQLHPCVGKGGRTSLSRARENLAIVMARSDWDAMRFATIAEVKDQLSRYLRRARREREPIVVTHYGRPYALIQALDEEALEELAWGELAKRQLERAWEDEDDALYDYL